MRLVLVDDDGQPITAAADKRKPTRRRRRMTAAERAERAAIRTRVLASAQRAKYPRPVLVASLTPDDRVQRMAEHYRVHGTFGPDLARRPGT